MHRKSFMNLSLDPKLKIPNKAKSPPKFQKKELFDFLSDTDDISTNNNINTGIFSSQSQFPTVNTLKVPKNQSQQHLANRLNQINEINFEQFRSSNSLNNKKSSSMNSSPQRQDRLKQVRKGSDAKFVPFTNERDHIGRLINKQRDNQKNQQIQEKQPLLQIIKQTKNLRNYNTLDKLREKRHNANLVQHLDKHYTGKSHQLIFDRKKDILPFLYDDRNHQGEIYEAENIDQKMNHLFLDANNNIIYQKLDETDNNISGSQTQREANKRISKYQAQKSHFYHVNIHNNSREDTNLTNNNLTNISQNNLTESTQQNIKQFDPSQINKTEGSPQNRSYLAPKNEDIERFKINTNLYDLRKKQQNLKTLTDSSQMMTSNLLSVNSSVNLKSIYGGNQELKNRFKLNSVTHQQQSASLNHLLEEERQQQRQKLKKTKKRIPTDQVQVQSNLAFEEFARIKSKHQPSFKFSKAKKIEHQKDNYFHADYTKEEEQKPDKFEQIMTEIRHTKSVLPILKIGKNNAIVQETFKQRQNNQELERKIVGDEDRISNDFEDRFKQAKRNHRNMKQRIEQWKMKGFGELAQIIKEQK